MSFNKKRLALIITASSVAAYGLIGSTFAASGDLATAINGLSAQVGTQSTTLINGTTGILIGSIVALGVITVVVGYTKGWFGGRK